MRNIAISSDEEVNPEINSPHPCICMYDDYSKYLDIVKVSIICKFIFQRMPCHICNM